MRVPLSSNPQVVPSSPLLPLHSSSHGFRDEASGEMSFHGSDDNLAPSGLAKESLSSKNVRSGDGFSSPASQPFPISSRLDPSLQHLLYGTVSPAVPDTPSPAPTANRSHSAYSSPPAHRHLLRASEELMNSDGQVESTDAADAAANFSVASPEGEECLREMVCTSLVLMLLCQCMCVLLPSCLGKCVWVCTVASVCET